MVVFSGHHGIGNGAIGVTALAIATEKLRHSAVDAVLLGILGNALVCLAVWLTYSARTTTDRILAIVPPIATFVAAGFEHSVANMYFIPAALLLLMLDDSEQLARGSALSIEHANLSWIDFLAMNLIPVTLGNIIGGAVLVGVVYWFIYLRKA